MAPSESPAAGAGPAVPGALDATFLAVLYEAVVFSPPQMNTSEPSDTWLAAARNASGLRAIGLKLCDFVPAGDGSTPLLSTADEARATTATAATDDPPSRRRRMRRDRETVPG